MWCVVYVLVYMCVCALDVLDDTESDRVTVQNMSTPVSDRRATKPPLDLYSRGEDTASGQ